jgi:DNA polymerase III subunit delta
VNAGKTLSWNQAEASSLVVIFGPEHYLASRAISKIKIDLRAANPDLEIDEIAEGEYANGLLFSLASPSLFGDARLVVVLGAAEELSADMERYLQEPNPDCTVIIRLPNLVGHNGKFKTKFSKQALNIACEELKRDNEKLAFIAREFQARNVTLEPQAARLLLLAFTNELGELGAACSQLASLGKPKVTKEDVEATFSGRIETNAFKIADAAMAGNAAEAIRLFRHGSATGIDPVALTAALAMRVRQLARLFNDRNSNAAALGMAPWQVDKARKELAGWTEQELVELVQLVAKTDADVKGAAREPEYSVERLLLAMAKAVN